MMIQKRRPEAVAEPRLSFAFFVAITAGGLWTWAVALLATRHHLVGTYGVVQGAPWFWGLVALPGPLLFLILVLGVLLTLLCLRYGRATGQRFPRSLAWLLSSAFVPALDLFRLLGVDIPLTFVEPLAITAVTAFAVGEMAAPLPIPLRLQQRFPWPAAVWLVAALLGIWWYFQGVGAYDCFMLGFNDFGHFGQRVANTWAGRGFLMETPSLPPFWDHFNPGLALLAPLWGLWPDPRLFMLLQAVCLASAAPILYAITRQVGASQVEAAMWATAHLVYPPLSQLNLSYSYGWHPVSLALPLLFLTILCLLKKQRIGALAAALLACSFQEDVVVILGCLAAAMALQLAWARWLAPQDDSPSFETNPLACALPIWVWAAMNLVLIVAFVLIYEFAGFRPFQLSRFDRLGQSGLEIMASPILRPAAFWGTVLRPESAYYLAALLVPLGLRSLYRGRWILLACAFPVVVLLAWGHRPATTIAFQYTTTFIPILFLAAIVGGRTSGDGNGSQGSVGPMWRATVTAWVGCAAASLWLGSTPWCENTQLDVFGQSYAMTGLDRAQERLPGSEGLEELHQVVSLVRCEKASSVLATGRIASHFIGIERLDTVGQAPLRWAAFESEAGPDRPAIELFEWIVVDTYERFQQSDKDIWFILQEAERAGYRRISARRGIVVFRRPDK